MKKFIFILVAVFATTFTSFAQITTMSAFEKKVEKVVVEYDVTKNFLGTENMESYVGQVLYVNGIYKSSQEYGYRNFAITKERCSYGAIKYEVLFGKYFKVLNVDKEENGLYAVFTLQNRDDENDIVYFRYNGRFEFTFPFIVVSYFEWCKNNLIGNKYLLNDSTVETDFFTGENIVCNVNEIWECIDVTIEDKWYDFVMLLKNKNGNVIAYKIEYIDDIRHIEI